MQTLPWSTVATLLLKLTLLHDRLPWALSDALAKGTYSDLQESPLQGQPCIYLQIAGLSDSDADAYTAEVPQPISTDVRLIPSSSDVCEHPHTVCTAKCSCPAGL